ncbi:AfsR/SARP family transcriptional regulator [Kitasatospora kifunensis]|uniref:DNA-binding SARP family transcriptional activator n=1 Tax=Kitasatospora kifunensis TaxID=58351 RepID=A0A7W7R3R2_KITKI|nr:AfsR/SARP family transcriptional regulator [Kitasatospora kifunensis]MBB4924865.1 DNA-binding SARP family transcriptional activator [Kitasatospora kifunensis]
MYIGLLGPLRVDQSGVSIVPTASKPRKVLALLACRADRLVSVEALIEEVWGEHPPRSVQTTLQTYVLQLRGCIAAALGDQSPEDLPLGSKSVLATEPGGYLLDTQGGSLDSVEFEQLCRRGHRAMGGADYAAASTAFRQALDLWRGPALVDVQCGPLLEAEAHALEESRLSILGRRIEADLRLGRHHELVGELAGLSARYPLHEGLQAQLMIALYRSGRRSSALETYQRLRTVLSRELGLDPSPELRELQSALLDADPGLDLARSAAPGRLLRAI